jgi:hypothetical protein
VIADTRQAIGPLLPMTAGYSLSIKVTGLYREPHHISVAILWKKTAAKFEWFYSGLL